MSLVIGETAELSIVLEAIPGNNIHKQILTVAAGIVIENNQYFERNQYSFFGNAGARERMIHEVGSILDNPGHQDYESAVEAVFYNAAHNQFLPKYDPDGSRGVEMRHRYTEILVSRKLIGLEKTDVVIDNNYMVETILRLNTENESSYISTLSEILSNISNFMTSSSKSKAQTGLLILMEEVSSLRHEKFGADIKNQILKDIIRSFKFVTAIEKIFPEKLPKHFTRENIFNTFGQEFYTELYGEEYIISETTEVA